MTNAIIAGAKPRSHVGGGNVGVLVVHGFTGTPASMRPIADAVVAANLHLEQPLLPGHGTVVADMCATGWKDWMAAVRASAVELSKRVSSVVVCGQSMGATLGLALVLEQKNIDGAPIDAMVCINPLTMPRSDEEIELVEGLIEDGVAVVPGEGSDLADPNANDVGYDGTPLRPLRSLLLDGIVPIFESYGEIGIPLLLFTSRADHVVDPTNSSFLAGAYGGPVEHRWMERSYHVAAIDFDRDEIAVETVRFVQRIVS